MTTDYMGDNKPYESDNASHGDRCGSHQRSGNKEKEPFPCRIEAKAVGNIVSQRQGVQSFPSCQGKTQPGYDEKESNGKQFPVNHGEIAGHPEYCPSEAVIHGNSHDQHQYRGEKKSYAHTSQKKPFRL